MIEVNDRVVLNDAAIKHYTNIVGENVLKSWGVDMRGFGEGLVVEVCTQDSDTRMETYTYAVVKWENPQILRFGDEPDKLLDQVCVEYLEKVAQYNQQKRLNK